MKTAIPEGEGATEYVVVLIEGKEPFEDMLDGKLYRIKPGEQTVVPLAAARLWFGYPDIYSPDRHLRERAENRIRNRRGPIPPFRVWKYGGEPQEESPQKNEAPAPIPEKEEEEEFPELKTRKRPPKADTT